VRSTLEKFFASFLQKRRPSFAISAPLESVTHAETDEQPRRVAGTQPPM
jgi:hypothetical protein